METFLLCIKSITKLRMVVEHHFYSGKCSQKEKEFMLSNVFNYVTPHFYIVWKILKKSSSGASYYRWIQMDFYSSLYIRRTFFEGILL